MSLDDTLRWAESFIMREFTAIKQWPDQYSTPESENEPNWAWLDLWEQENPYPYLESLSFEEWYDEKTKMSDRVWVAHCLPQFHVFDWSDEDVALARKVVSRHVCGVCGRSDDSGCVLGC